MIRATPGLQSTRLLMLTSSGSSREVATRAGVDGFAAKPARESHLASEIARVLDPAGGVPSAARAATDPAAAAGRRLAGLSVLVAEDNTINQLVATRMLEKRGCRVHVARNGREAVEMHARDLYALIFMDCQMPVLDGYEATAEIRQQENGAPRTQIIAMTANTLKGDRERCLDAGMDDYIGKPLRARDLEDVLFRALDSAARPAAASAGDTSGGSCDEQVDARPPLLDSSQLDETFGGDDRGRADLVTLFLGDSRIKIAELAEAIEANQAAAAAGLAHGLKGAAAAVGAVRLSAEAGDMHAALKTGGDPAAARTELERTFALTEAALLADHGTPADAR